MSSAASIDKAGAHPGRANQGTAAVRAGEPHETSFRPWHFFVLASLLAATAAVVLSRQSTPETLALVSLTIGAAGAAAAGFYRMIAPLAAEDATTFGEPLSDRQRTALEREKALVLRSIKELEFDRAMGKLSPKDFEEMSARLRARALSLIKELDEGGSGYRELIERELNARLATARAKRDAAAPAGRVESAAAGRDAAVVSDKTCSCGTVNDADAAFCKRCGARVA